MNGNIKFGFFKMKIWWFIFLAIQVFLLMIIIGSLGTPRWVKTKIQNSYISMSSYNNTKTDYFDGSKFQGSLSNCKEGCNDKYSKFSSD